MHVEQILAHKGSKIFTVRPDVSIADAADTLRENRIGAVLVCAEDGIVAGVLSERDIVRGLSAKGAACLGMLVQDLMTRDVVFCKPEDSINEVMALMTDRRIRHLPVMADNQLLGVISIGDVVKHRMREIEHEADAMRAYIATG